MLHVWVCDIHDVDGKFSKVIKKKESLIARCLVEPIHNLKAKIIKIDTKKKKINISNRNIRFLELFKRMLNTYA